jgi:hypothetical protein
LGVEWRYKGHCHLAARSPVSRTQEVKPIAPISAECMLQWVIPTTSASLAAPARPNSSTSGGFLKKPVRRARVA